MGAGDPGVTAVTSKGQTTIPSRLRGRFGLEQGTKLMVVPADCGLVLKKLDLPSVEEVQRQVEERAERVDLSMEEANEFVREAQGSDEWRQFSVRTYSFQRYCDRYPTRGRRQGIRE